FVTATPSDATTNTNPPAAPGAPATAAATGNAAAPASDASVPREKQALRAALAVLGKQLGQKITYVKQWSWELDAFNDSAHGCPAEYRRSEMDQGSASAQRRQCSGPHQRGARAGLQDSAVDQGRKQ